MLSTQNNMQFLVHYGRTFTFLLLLFPFLGLSASYLYLQYQDSKKEIVQTVQNNMLYTKEELIEIYLKHLETKYSKNYIEVLKRDEAVRKSALESLVLMKNSEVQYLYLLYIDEKNRFRYLLDTTKGLDERGEFKQRFIPQKDIWKKAQASLKPEITRQEEIDKLWISMAYPIIIDKKCVAFIGIDFSHDEYVEVQDTLVPLESIYLYSVIFILVMLVSAFVQLVIYYKHRKKSFIDPLTGMLNRQYLYNLLQRYDYSNFQILIMDLDHFKQVNDIYGHDAGDEVLRTVSQRISSSIRKKDTLIRYGGEEFLLLIWDKDPEVSKALAERIRLKVRANPVKIADAQLKVTISMGLNPFTQESKSFDLAVKVADEGLYMAKKLGRDRVEVYDANSGCDEEPSAKMCDVRDALDDERIYCVYQPIYKRESEGIHAYELLVRMKDEQGKEIVPSKFLPSIRHTQVYVHLTQRVFEIALKTLEEKKVNLCINLDIEDLLNDEVLELFTLYCEKSPELIQYVYIELLQSEVWVDFEAVVKRLDLLQSFGLKIILDDFGRGYANYSYLLNRQIDSVKIDASLIANIDQNQQAQKVLLSICALAKEMGISTIAEHIQTKEELDFVKSTDIDFLQGYYLAKPQEKI